MTNIHLPHLRSGNATSQRGVALIVVMMFIVILSGIAAFSAKRAISGEGLARNQLDVEVARQAAEAALRDAEFDLLIRSSGVLPGAVCARKTSATNAARPIAEPASTGAPFFDADCPLGQCRLAPDGQEANYAALSNADTNDRPQPWWPNSGLWNNTFSSKPPTDTACNFRGGVPFGTFSGAPRIRGVLRQPEYLIEYINRTGEPKYFRITARGWGLSNNSEVVMQSYFMPTKPVE
jgi:type IV pilus assembly protein PilX